MGDITLESIKESLADSKANKEYCPFMDDVEWLLDELDKHKEIIVAAINYRNSEAIGDAAMKDGVNVQGALMEHSGCRDMLDVALRNLIPNCVAAPEQEKP